MIRLKDIDINKNCKILKIISDKLISDRLIDVGFIPGNIIKKVLHRFNAEIVPIEISKDIPQLPVKINGTICVCPTVKYEGFFIAKIRKNK